MYFVKFFWFTNLSVIRQRIITGFYFPDECDMHILYIVERNNVIHFQLLIFFIE